MVTQFFQRFALVTVAGAVVGLTACGGDVSPTGSAASRTITAFIVGDPTNSTPEYGKIKVCKSASSNVSGTFTVSRVAVGASSGTVEPNPTVAPGNCTIVAEDAGLAGSGSNVTISESSAGLVSVSATRIDLNPSTGLDVISSEPFADGGTKFVNGFHGFTITFENTVVIPPPPPPPGGQGCSPGYWKNHNFPAGYTKGQLFSSVFEDAFPGKSLQTVLSTGGGGLTALGRHTVSALLNAAALGGNYELTTAQVIAKFNAVFPGGNYSALAAEFAALQDVNGRVCPNPTGK